LNQRIAIRHRLSPLTRSEMEAYIRQRLQVAGANGNIIFSRSAFKEIYKFSKGTPRLINLLCDRSLLGGFVDQTCHIDKRIVKKAKKSLLGEESASASSRALALLSFMTPLRIFLLIILFLVASMTLSSQSQFHPAHIQRRGEKVSQSIPLINPVRDSSGALNPAGIILRSNPAISGTAEQWGIISNGVKNLHERPLGNFEGASIGGENEPDR
jgi:general secretion pathway protein A